MKRYRGDGYDVMTEESAAALRDLQHTTLGGQEKAIYDALVRLGKATRYDLAAATGLHLLMVTRRIAGLRNTGLLRQLPKQYNQIGPTGKECSTLAAVPKFLKAARDRRFKSDFDEWAELTAQHKAKLREAWELKAEAMQVLKRIHKKIRRMSKAKLL